MDETLSAQLPYTLREADFPLLGELYRGKVRDNYSKGDRIVMITTDRLSAFDRVLTTIPFKGEILNYTKNGEPRWIELDVQPLRGENGVVNGFALLTNKLSLGR